MIRSLGLLIGTSALYGYTVGSAHSQIYALRNLVKLPLLILGTAAICALSYYIFGRAITAALSLSRVRDLVIGLFRDLSILLASLAPPNYFLAQVMLHTDDAQLGEYSLFLGLNVLFVAVSGCLVLLRRGRQLLATCQLTRARTASILISWLALSLLVGGQAAFLLRPFFGLPASRGNTPPFAVWAEPDVRGATNFFEAVIQVFTEPPLPRVWGEPPR